MPLTPETLALGRELYRKRTDDISKQRYVPIEEARARAQAAQKNKGMAESSLPPLFPEKP